MNNTRVWNKVLSDGEEVRYEFGISSKYRMVATISFVILGALLFLWSAKIAIPWIIVFVFHFYIYQKLANAYAFTDKRVLIHRGWLSTNTISVDYDKITDVIVEEPVIDRLLSSSGNLKINTAGSSSQEIILKHIDSPYETKKKLGGVRGA